MFAKKSLLFTLFFCFFTFFSPLIAQKVKKLDYQEVKKLYLANTDENYRIELVNNYLKLAKAQKSWDDVASAYMLFINQYTYKDENKALAYNDSIMKIKHLIKNEDDIEFYYYKQGVLFRVVKKYEKAIESFNYNIIRNKKNKNYYLSLFEIALIKSVFLENFKEAIVIYEEVYSYFKDNQNNEVFDPVIYLHSLFNLSNSNKEINNLKKSNFYNQIGLKESIKHKNEVFKNLFILNEGSVLLKRKNYLVALDSINKAYPFFYKIKLNHQLLPLHFYKGKCYEGLGKPMKSVNEYTIVDSLYNLNSFNISPKYVYSYTYLINHYKKEKNYEKQLYYTNQLLKIDSTFRQDYKTIINKLQKDYDLPQLTKEKEALIKQLENKGAQKNYGLWVLLLVALSSLALAYYKHLQKKKVEDKIQEISQTAQQPILQLVALPEEPVGLQKDPLPMNIVLDLEVKLKKFEKNLGFLRSDLDSKSLAADLDSNVKYLSVFINQYGKGLKFNDYINQLRINYVIQQLDNQPKWQNYSIDALANEAGFNRADTFSKAFYKQTNLKPSDYIKNICLVKKQKVS
jgi:AraC-like DNA-binding protein